MTTPTITATVPRICLRREEAAASLGVSVDVFDERIRSEVKAIRRGRLVLYPTVELERWARENAATVLGEQG